MYAGKWITGYAGAKRLALLAAELDKKHIELTIEKTGKNWSNYAPWMSCVDGLEFFSKRPLKLPCSSSRLLKDRDSLELIAEGFAIGDSPFGSLRLPEVDGFFIDQDVSVIAQIEIENAVESVRSASDAFDKRWSSLIDLVVPIGFRRAEPSDLGRGLSSHFFRKGIFIQPPRPSSTAKMQLALNIAHELGHQALFTYQNADPIIDGDRDILVYSVIRKTFRPAIRSYHALVVSGYMLEFLIALKRNSSIDLSQINTEMTRYRTLVIEGVKEFRGSSLKFTELGLEILSELEQLGLAEGLS